MKKLLPVLKTVGRVLFLVFQIGSIVASLAAAYVLFAPDEMPKPFYLEYRPPEATQAAAATEEAGEPGQETPEDQGFFDRVAASVSGLVGGGEEGQAEGEQAQATQAAPLEISPGQGIMLNTGTRVVNTADAGGRRYLRVTVVLEFAPTDPAYYSLPVEEQAAYTATFTDELNARLPVINDMLTSVLSSKTFEEIYTVAGKEALRAEILGRLEELLPDHQVVYVYFTEFAVQ